MEKINKIIAYIQSKPKETQQKILNHVDTFYGENISLGAKCLIYYKKNKPEIYKEIIEDL